MRLFVLALPEEINLATLEIQREEITQGQEVYFLDDDTILSFTGVGKVNAAQNLTYILSRFPKVDTVVNFGSCGSIHPIAPLTVLKATSFQYLDVDVTGFGYPINALPKTPKIFQFGAPEATIGTADSFITRQNYTRYFELDLVDGIDMEGAALAQVCARFHLQFWAYKVVSDVIFGETESNPEMWDNNIAQVAQIITELVEEEWFDGRTIHPEL